mmetsp:Transcript_7484/g.15248  ORF Transcript_7484/g.15248 Transcript_7484/m.15248 type:complete len:400 (-) Transcript_7484:174-1373(-)
MSGHDDDHDESMKDGPSGNLPPEVDTRTASTTMTPPPPPPPIPKTEKQKMLDGDWYNAFDPTLLRDRQRAKQLCFELNQTSPLDTKRRWQLTQQMLGSGGPPPVNPWVESPFHVDYGYNLRVGANFYANHGCTILDGNIITIGDNCLLGPHVCLSAATHPLDPQRRANGDELTAPIAMGHNCWLGAGCTILPGVTLGNGVVVGAGAVVTPSSCRTTTKGSGSDGGILHNVVLAGVPAKVIRRIETTSTTATAVSASASAVSISAAAAVATTTTAGPPDDTAGKVAMMMGEPPRQQQQEERDISPPTVDHFTVPEDDAGKRKRDSEDDNNNNNNNDNPIRTTFDLLDAPGLEELCSAFEAAQDLSEKTANNPTNDNHDDAAPSISLEAVQTILADAAAQT